VGNPDAIRSLEAIVHPLVRAVSEGFIKEQAARGARVIVLDIPLLFETGGEKRVDAVVVVSAPAAVQRARVLSRAGMTAERLDALLARQMSDAEKRTRAHFVVDSSRSFDSARAQVHGILRAIAPLPGRRIG
jgi:dephospho-CoA kinase